MDQALDLYRRTADSRARVPAVVSGVPAVADDQLDFGTLITTLKRHRTLFMATFVTIIVATLIVTLLQHPRYTATSQIVISLKDNTIAPRATAQTDDPDSAPSDLVDTEVKVLTSRELASRVADVLKLDQSLSFNPALAAPAFHLRDAIKNWLGMTKPKTPPTTDLQRSIIDRLLAGLQVTRSGSSYAIDLAASAPTAIDAQRIANAFAQEYIHGQIDTKQKDNRATEAFLANRLEELRGQAHNDMERVQQYRIAHNLLSTSGASFTEQEISAYNQSVSGARAEAAEDEARLNTARAQLAHGSNGDDVGEALGSTVVSQLRARQADVSGRLADLQARYNDVHPDVVRAKSELADVDSRINAEIMRVVSNLEAKARVSNERLASLNGSLAGARGALAQNNRSMTDLDDLERRAGASQALYDSYLGRYKEVSAGDGEERANARLISLAELPHAPASPNLPLNMLLGVVLGLLGATAASFVAEQLFSGLTTAADVEGRFQLPFLAGIPSMQPREGCDTPSEAVTASPRSLFAEAFRMLRTAIGHSHDGAPGVVVITSSLPSEGKTTVATCLARSAAQAGEDVLLIDFDRRRARLSRDLFEAQNKGLVEVIRGEASLDEAMTWDKTTSLRVLPLSSSDNHSPIEEEAIVRFLDHVRHRFRLIIIDSSPLLPIAETQTLCAAADAVVLVTRWRHTPHQAVKAALRLLPATHVNLLGIVLSRINMRQQARFARGDASSYYRRYQKYYA